MSVKWLNIADYCVESRLDISKKGKKQSWKEVPTLDSGINIGVCLLIFELFSRGKVPY